MKLNTNLVNLMTQLMLAIENSGSTDPVYRINDKEVQCLFKATQKQFAQRYIDNDSDMESALHCAENDILGQIQLYMVN